MSAPTNMAKTLTRLFVTPAVTVSLGGEVARRPSDAAVAAKNTARLRELAERVDMRRIFDIQST